MLLAGNLAAAPPAAGPSSPRRGRLGSSVRTWRPGPHAATLLSTRGVGREGPHRGWRRVRRQHRRLGLPDDGIVPVVLDNLVTGRAEFTRDRIFYHGDIADGALIDQIFAEHPDIAAVVHAAR